MTGNNDRPVLVYGTAPDSGTAEYIAGELLNRRLIASANVLPGMITHFDWRGKRQKDGEVMMIFATRASLADAAVAEAKVHHPIATPAFVVVAATGGHGPHLDWIFDQTEPRIAE
jgi:periplasmic divalent cation tolerance protein